MGDTIGPNARDKAIRRPEKIVGPTQPLHHRVGVNHTPARLAQGKLLRAHHPPFELGPEPAQGRVQPCLSYHLSTVVVVGELGRATPWHLCEVSCYLKNLRALEIHQEPFGYHEHRATQI